MSQDYFAVKQMKKDNMTLRMTESRRKKHLQMMSQSQISDLLPLDMPPVTTTDKDKDIPLSMTTEKENLVEQDHFYGQKKIPRGHAVNIEFKRPKKQKRMGSRTTRSKMRNLTENLKFLHTKLEELMTSLNQEKMQHFLLSEKNRKLLEEHDNQHRLWELNREKIFMQLEEDAELQPTNNSREDELNNERKAKDFWKCCLENAEKTIQQLKDTSSYERVCSLEDQLSVALCRIDVLENEKEFLKSVAFQRNLDSLLDSDEQEITHATYAQSVRLEEDVARFRNGVMRRGKKMRNVKIQCDTRIDRNVKKNDSDFSHLDEAHFKNVISELKQDNAYLRRQLKQRAVKETEIKEDRMIIPHLSSTANATNNIQLDFQLTQHERIITSLRNENKSVKFENFKLEERLQEMKGFINFVEDDLVTLLPKNHIKYKGIHKFINTMKAEKMIPLCLERVHAKDDKGTSNKPIYSKISRSRPRCVPRIHDDIRSIGGYICESVPLVKEVTPVQGETYWNNQPMEVDISKNVFPIEETKEAEIKGFN